MKHEILLLHLVRSELRECVALEIVGKSRALVDAVEENNRFADSEGSL